MKRIKRRNRFLAVALSAVMAFGGLPTAALAEGQGAQAAYGLCEHHGEHTAECGYVEGQPCEHRVNGGGDDRESPWVEVHSEACYRDELICGYDAEMETIATGSDAGHTHTQECHKMDCPHERGEHDDTCSYVEIQLCGYTCELCREPAGPEPKPGDKTEQTVCTLTEGCTLPAGHEGGCETELPPVDGALVNTIRSWKFIGDENLNEGELPMPGVNIERQADFDMVVSMLPSGISAEIEGKTETIQVDITGWSCPEYVRDENDNWPVTGEYVFTAELPEDYICDPLPSVKALIGGAELYTDTPVGDFIITGDSSKYCTWDEERQLLTIKSGATLTIKNKDPNTSTWHMIKVEETAKDVEITLDGVNINRKVSLDPAFDMANATVTLILAEGSENILIGSQYHRAGLEVPANATLIIDGSGTLRAEGENGAGIGGFGTEHGSGENAGNSGAITIRGSVQVKATSVGGAGIGGGGKNGGQGNGGTGGQITIEKQANVDAVSKEGAGIGGGKGDGDGCGGGAGSVTIKDEAIVSASSDRGAGIGGGAAGMDSNGKGGDGGTIIIQDKAQVTATSKMFGSGAGAGIGGGRGGFSGLSGKGGDVKISGEGVKVTASGFPDVGGNQGGSLLVDKATLDMPKNGTNAETKYQNCTVIQNGISTEYNGQGDPIASPALSLSVSPLSSQTHPGDVILTAILSGASGGNAGKKIEFTGSGTHHVDTDDSGIATYTFEKLSPGTYDFGASFAGDSVNKPAAAESIKDYIVSIGEQEELSIEDLDNTYTYGDDTFVIGTSGGSGTGAVSYQSSDESVASVTGDKVTILKAGTFTITATKEGDSNYSKKSFTSGTVTVNPAAPEVRLTAAGGTDIYDPIELTATVSAVKTGATPTGTVTFKEGDTTLEENVLLDDGKATCKVSSLTAGNHTYTAVYSGRSGFYDGANADHIVDVGFADQTDFAITDPGTKTYGDGDFVLETTGEQSVGDVDFSVPADNGVLTMTADGKVKITGAGKVAVEATKAGDSIYKPATATLDITVAPRDISNVTVSVTGSRVYTGVRLQPAFDLNDGNIAVTASDYTHRYGSNADAGIGAGSITLTGQRNYTGTKEVKFNIEKCSLDSAVITLEAVSYTHTGSEIKPAVTNVVVDGITVPDSAFDVGYADNIAAGTATVTVTAKTGGNFSGSANAIFEIKESGEDGGEDSSSSGDSTAAVPKNRYTSTGNQIGQSILHSDLQRLIDAGKGLTVQSGTATMTLDPAALRAILGAVPAAAGDIAFAAAPADISAFPDAAALIGTRPVYSFSISRKDSNGSMMPVNVNFPAGSVSISLSYTPVEGEVTGSLFMVYVDDKGAVTWLDKSGYNVNDAGGRVLADVPHFSVYGVAYKASVPVFTDITNHWAKADMEFAAARGLLFGTGEKVFSPDAAMTRGMFVTALGRLAGVNPDSYQMRSFQDVKADAYYAAYVEWAAQKDIVKGTGEGLFSPDAPVTREQMAVIMDNYAGQMGYSIPAPLEEVTFADNDKIGAWAAKEVAAMQRAGIIKGKDGNRFDPQASATRAEVSAALRRFVQTDIDPATAAGWVKNDSGHWLYYQSEKVLTGWQTIGKLRYYFNTDGVMHEGWKQDTSTGKWYFWTNAGVVIGWRKIDRKWYYFDENGIMAVNTSVDGHEIGLDGARKEQ